MHSIEDLRRAARHKLPKSLFDYVDGGTDDGVGMAANRAALDSIKLVPRILSEYPAPDEALTILGSPAKLPMVVAPTAVAGMMWANGEVLMARAAKAAGIPFCASTLSICDLETIVETGANTWLQLYLWRDRQLSYDLVERAEKLGVEVLLLTIDTPLTPKREHNLRNGFSFPPKPNPRLIADIILHPGWLIGVLLPHLMTYGMPAYSNHPQELRRGVGEDMDPRLKIAGDVTWRDIRELRRRWKGRFLLKGILSADDVRQAASLGLDGVVVSNHGGRNFDGFPSTVDVLPACARNAGDGFTILADSGVRRGSDIARLLALGADGVLLGRAPIWGLAAAGERGAIRALDILGEEYKTALTLLGCRSLSDLRDRDVIIAAA